MAKESKKHGYGSNQKENALKLTQKAVFQWIIVEFEICLNFKKIDNQSVGTEKYYNF